MHENTVQNMLLIKGGKFWPLVEPLEVIPPCTQQTLFWTHAYHPGVKLRAYLHPVYSSLHGEDVFFWRGAALIDKIPKRVYRLTV